MPSLRSTVSMPPFKKDGAILPFQESKMSTNRYWATGVEMPNLSQPPLKELVDFTTPAEKMFFLRHMAMPSIDRRKWQVEIAGQVRRPIKLSLGDLASMKQVSISSVHECAGHPFHPTVPVRRVANVTWGGVRLQEVLDRAEVLPGAQFIWSYGIDGGDYHGIDIPAYVKDLPLPEVTAGDVMLATHLNGQELDDKHGGPVRLVVPGYYGTNSTKWLERLELREMRSPGYFTTTMYNDTVMRDGQEVRTPVWGIQPHSVLIDPSDGDLVAAGHPSRLHGWAWSSVPVVRVEVSTDGGASWCEASLHERLQRSWQHFDASWIPNVGTHVLMCRAFDREGRDQPATGFRNSVFSATVSAA